MKPNWPLIKHLELAVNSAPGGGIHRGDLSATTTGCSEFSIRDALMILYRNRKVDFCGMYVVKPRSQ